MATRDKTKSQQKDEEMFNTVKDLTVLLKQSSEHNFKNEKVTDAVIGLFPKISIKLHGLVFETEIPINSIINFNEPLRKLIVSMGLNSNEAAILKREIDDISSMPILTSELVELAAELHKSGFTVKQIEMMFPYIARGAIASTLNLNIYTKSVADVLRNANVEQENVLTVLEELNAAKKLTGARKDPVGFLSALADITYKQKGSVPIDEKELVHEMALLAQYMDDHKGKTDGAVKTVCDIIDGKALYKGKLGDIAKKEAEIRATVGSFQRDYNSFAESLPGLTKIWMNKAVRFGRDVISMKAPKPWWLDGGEFPGVEYLNGGRSLPSALTPEAPINGSSPFDRYPLATGLGRHSDDSGINGLSKAAGGALTVGIMASTRPETSIMHRSLSGGDAFPVVVTNWPSQLYAATGGLAGAGDANSGWSKVQGSMGRLTGVPEQTPSLGNLMPECAKVQPSGAINVACVGSMGLPVFVTNWPVGLSAGGGAGGGEKGGVTGFLDDPKNKHVVNLGGNIAGSLIAAGIYARYAASIAAMGSLAVPVGVAIAAAYGGYQAYNYIDNDIKKTERSARAGNGPDFNKNYGLNLAGLVSGEVFDEGLPQSVQSKVTLSRAIETLNANGAEASMNDQKGGAFGDAGTITINLDNKFDIDGRHQVFSSSNRKIKLNRGSFNMDPNKYESDD